MNTVGRFGIVGVIGSGGFGTVYRGIDPADGSRVAVKVLDRGSPADPDFLARVEREATAMRQVSDQHCVRVRDVVVEPGVAAIVTDFVDGASLRAVLDRYGRLTGPQAVEILRGALLGLVAVHRAGLLHGDVKPDNILVDRAGVSRLIDFGLAAAPVAVAVHSARVTGSPGYLSPEQIRGEPTDERSDVYACAVMLFELLTGHRPYGGDTLPAVLNAHLSAPVPDPRAVEPSIGPVFAGLAMRGLAKEPAARPPSAADFLTELEVGARQQYGTAWRTGLALGGLAGGVAATAADNLAGAVGGGGGVRPARLAMRAGRRVSTRLATTLGGVAVAGVAATTVALTAGGHAASNSASGRCSDPHPSPTSLIFAGVVCVDSIEPVRQPDGSTELLIRVSVTNEDPNNFHASSWDFQLVDSSGDSIDAEDAGTAGRSGVGRCIYQPLLENGWLVKSGTTFTVPGPYCFNVPRGERASQLQWQNDVFVQLR